MIIYVLKFDIYSGILLKCLSIIRQVLKMLIRIPGSPHVGVLK